MSKESDIPAIDTFEVEAGKLLVPVDTSHEDLKAQLDSMMEKSQDGDIKYSCTLCGKQAKGEGREDVESSNEIPYELAQFEIHLRQPVKIHNIRKRMQQEQQASSSSENGKLYFYYTCAIIFLPHF